MTKDDFIFRLRNSMAELSALLSAPDGEWAVKGFVDVYKRIYTVSSDTKVVSKIIELCIFPFLCRFAEENELTLELTKEQNFYPDVTFIDKEGNLFAVDVKSSYRKSETRINGMTLGAFTGYFRNRESCKNTAYSYGDYKAHLVLGVIYSMCEGIDERTTYRLQELGSISSVIRDIECFVQEKWRIASCHPGSGNTKNIGSVTDIETIKGGSGPFSGYGEDMFDDYWMHYLTMDMARKAELSAPFYHDMQTYKAFKHID